MLIDELCAIVDLVVDDHVEAILGVVSSDVLVGELGHFGGLLRKGSGFRKKKK